MDALSNALRNTVDLLNTLSHDLRTSINVITGNIGLIQDGLFGPLTPELEKRVHLKGGTPKIF